MVNTHIGVRGLGSGTADLETDVLGSMELEKVHTETTIADTSGMAL